MRKIETWALEKLVRDDGMLRDFAAGERIFAQGDPGTFMAVVLRGSVVIQRSGAPLAEIEAGSVFGEMALIDGLPRSGDAVAKTHCRLAMIDEPHFKNLVRELPDFALSLMKILVERLRARLEN
jgi:CRP-like cAMP-binding protein